MLDFPSSPTTGQTFSSPGGTTWTFDGAKWGNGTLLTIPDAPSDANTYGRHAGSWNAVLTGITSAQVTGALGFTPYNATNPSGYQTSAQVTAALPVASSTAPLMDGAAAIGTGTTWARADHVHASDTSRAPLASPTFTGTATTPILAVAGPGNDPLTVTVANGNFARTRYTVTSTKTWSEGCNADGTFNISDETAPATRIQINAAGACFNTTGSWTAFSDRRLKQDIVPYERGLEAICQLNPVAFRFTERAPMGADGDALRYGLIADDVQPVMPEITGTMQIVLPGDAAPTEIATLESGLLVYSLINCVKELAAQNAALEARIAALEGARH